MFPIRVADPIETRKSFHVWILYVTLRFNKQDKYHKKLNVVIAMTLRVTTASVVTSQKIVSSYHDFSETVVI